MRQKSINKKTSKTKFEHIHKVMKDANKSETPIFDSLVFQLNHNQEMYAEHLNDSYGIGITDRQDGSDSPYAVLQTNYTTGRIEVMKNGLSRQDVEKLLSFSVTMNEFKKIKFTNIEAIKNGRSKQYVEELLNFPVTKSEFENKFNKN